MNRRLRWRVAVVVMTTVVMSMFAWYPPVADRYGLWAPGFMMARQLRLGLDLNGGVQMTLRVNTDDAVRMAARRTAEQIAAALTDEGVAHGRIEIVSAESFRIRDVDATGAAALGRISDELAREYTRATAIDGAAVFVMRPDAVTALRQETVRQAKQTVDRRVDQLGVLEPQVAVQGADELVVQLPGAENTDRAREVLGATALLEWKLVERGPAAACEHLVDPGTPLPAGTELVTGVAEEGARPCYLVRSVSEITGQDLRDARPATDPNHLPVVSFTLTSDAAARFARLTSEHVGRSLAIVLDGEVQSAPRIEGSIDRGEGQIQGRFTPQEVADLSLLLRAGSLPASMTYLGGTFVGPTLGTASIQAGIAASLTGLALVAAFMLLYYNRTGINAVASVIINLLILAGLMAYVGAAVTLPGIAGLILTIGMGVDSNILIFERIKEELAAGARVRAAVAAGFDRVFLTILDTHIASLIAAALLFQFGTGPIRGFATTLTFGLLANVFTAVFVSRTLFDLVLSRSRAATAAGAAGSDPRLRISTFGRTFRVPQLDVHRWRWPALILSAAVILAGAGAALARGVPLGIEFSGGTTMRTAFAAPVSEEAVRQAIPGDEIVQRHGAPGGNELLIRLPQANEAEVPDVVGAARRALEGAGLPAFEIAGTETVGPAIGADLRRKGAYAAIASLAGITGYIAFRFRPSFAIGAIGATVHDVLVTLSVLQLAGYDLTLNVVAAMLTITGYSVNDTIVTFDRVRENLRTMRRVPLAGVVNTAVNQTLGRTIITGGTTLVSVVALYALGGDVLRGFAFAMIVGVVSGTYSTVFIAAPIALLMSRRSGRAAP